MLENNLGKNLNEKTDEIEEVNSLDIKLYTVKEISELLQCNVSRVYELIDTGVLPVIETLGRTKIRHNSLVKTLENLEIVKQKED